MFLEKIATIISCITAFFLVLIKFFTGILTGSVSILYSAIDSLLDMFISAFNHFAVRNASKKADIKFNYGRGKIEALASFLEGLIIIVSGLYILYESIFRLINGEKIEFLKPALIVMGVSITITGILVLFLDFVAKKTKNIVIQTDSLHYKVDFYTNIGIILSLIIIYYTGFYYLDSIVGMILSVYIIFSAYKILKKGFLLLLDAALKKEQVKKITKIIDDTYEIKSHHLLKTRQSSKTNFVQAHLVFKNIDIKLINAHRISDKIEDKIKKIDESKTWIIDFHLDPYDDGI